MTSERWREVERLYHATLECAEGNRAAFLAACGADEELRREVESLLAQPDSHLRVLDSPAMAAVAHLVSHPRSPSMIGRRIRTYELVALLGAGGMGEVYRARDSRLGREVAIKILPSAFKADPDRVARFEREAQVLASLQHPHIGAIYGLEEEHDVTALVMELVEGEDLSARLARGPLPLHEALIIARQIADALDAAHEQGIIHRDLKPANIRLQRDGSVKVLDFGLAKPLSPTATNTPTLTALSQHAGAIIGTPAYMSPEQARGEATGREADIWAFGVLLYELLTGVSPFARPTTTETLARVVTAPPDDTRLPADTPASVRRLIRRCLEKDPKRRWRHIGDVRIEIEEALAAPSTEPTTPTAAAKPRLWYAAAVIALMALAGIVGWMSANRPSTASSPVVRLAIPSVEPPTAGPYGVRRLAIARDGSRIAYGSSNRLLIRGIGQKDGISIDVAATNPFFSPNGDWVGFFIDGSGLLKTRVSGGTSVPLVATSDRPRGGTWRADGTIVFATSEGLYQVSENGGEPTLLRKPDLGRGERGYAWPQFMPGGRSVLFTILPEKSADSPRIAVLDLATLDSTVVLEGGSDASYVPTGHLLYASQQVLKALAFDPETRRTQGDAKLLPDIEVATTLDNGAAQFALSETGTLVFITPTVPGRLRTLSWVDRRGNEESLAVRPGPYAYPRVSPDGTRVALDIPGASRDIWIWNLERRSLTKLTDGPTEDMMPLWSRDGQRLFFASDRAGNFDVYSQPADGATRETVAFAGSGVEMPISLTPDGTRLLVLENFEDLSVLDIAQPQRLEPLLHSQFKVQLAEVSPDGKWIAYESNEAGEQVEIFLRPFPDSAGRREKVSIKGGRYPVWGSHGSGELFYVDPEGGMMLASVVLSPTLTLGRVTKLFDWQPPARGISGRRYDISPVDGRFLMIKPAAGPSEAIDISVVLNWHEELKRVMAAR